MKSIALAGQKGGSARTCTSTSLAVIAEMAGIRSLVLDLDPQASATVWRDAREAEYPDVHGATAPRLPKMLEQAAEGGVGLTILDTPPNAEGTTMAACREADFVLIPMRPTPRDMAALESTVRLVRDVTIKPHAVVLAQCPTNTSAMTDEIAAAIAEAKVPLCPVRIHHRIAHYSRIADGLTATEADPKGKAAQELESLWQWLLDQPVLADLRRSAFQQKLKSGKAA